MPSDVEKTKETSKTYRLEDQVGYLLRLAGQRHTTIFQDKLPFNLTPTQFSALIRLGELGECSQNELGRRTAMDVATIKGVIDRLRKKGLVQVNPDSKDKRRALLSIAEEHKDITPDLWKAGFQISDETLKPLTQKERKDLVRLLKKISKN